MKQLKEFRFYFLEKERIVDLFLLMLIVELDMCPTICLVTAESCLLVATLDGTHSWSCIET